MSRFEDNKSILKAKHKKSNRNNCFSLEAVKGDGVRKTRIMFIAYLSYEQLNEYLNELLGKELLANDLDIRTYNITPKGSKYLELYAELEKVE